MANLKNRQNDNIKYEIQRQTGGRRYDNTSGYGGAGYARDSRKNRQGNAGKYETGFGRGYGSRGYDDRGYGSRGYDSREYDSREDDRRRKESREDARRRAQQRRDLRRTMRKAAKIRPPRVVTPTNLLLALIGFLFIFSFSVVLVLNLRTIYYFDIQAQKLEQVSGLSEEAIRENYDALIEYNLLTKGIRKLELPDFPMSEQGETHFKEVKRIFILVQVLCILTGAALFIGLCRKTFVRDYGSLKLISVFTFFIPAVLGVLAVFQWEKFFVKFHEIFFRNNYWIFDPATDPVINILPDAFFFHCAAAILFFVLLGGLLTGALYRFATRRYRAERI